MFTDPIKKCQNEDYRSSGSLISSSRNIDTFARLGGTTEIRNTQLKIIIFILNFTLSYLIFLL